MARHIYLIIFFSVAFASIIETSNAQKKPKTDAVLLPITKDQLTKQYYTSLHIGTNPRTPLNLVLDLGSSFTWFNCQNTNSSSSRRLVPCRSDSCTSVPGFRCDSRFCNQGQYNPIKKSIFRGPLNLDRASFHSTDGARTLARVSVQRFFFLCVGSDQFQGMAKPANGMLGLARSSFSIASQLSSAFNIIPKFTLCLPSSQSGRFFVGGGPYLVPPYTEDLTTSSALTFLSFDSDSTTPIPGNSNDYFITVNSITVDGNPISSINALLSIHGGGRTKISTLDPYTALQSDIYKALIKDFVKRAEAMGIRKVAAVAPFGACFDSSTVGRQGTGPNVPKIELMVPGRGSDREWRFYGANSMVEVSKKVMCLGLVDGGAKLRTSMVIGGHQLENYLLQFDLSRSELWISESLLLHNATCSYK